MIGFLKGSLMFRSDTTLLVDTGGVAYETQVSRSAFREMKEGDTVSLWIYTCVRQDSIELFGFSCLDEKQLFLSLLKVRGLGPKTALQILGSCSLDQFIRMVNEENIKALGALPKIGKKTAQQIVLTLKDQISGSLTDSTVNRPNRQKLVSALENLGFRPIEIRETLEKIKWKDHFEKDLKQALSVLNANSGVRKQ